MLSNSSVSRASVASFSAMGFVRWGFEFCFCFGLGLRFAFGFGVYLTRLMSDDSKAFNSSTSFSG